MDFVEAFLTVVGFLPGMLGGLFGVVIVIAVVGGVLFLIAFFLFDVLPKVWRYGLVDYVRARMWTGDF